LAVLTACNEISATCARLLGYVGVLFVLAALAAKLLGIGGVEAAVGPMARSNWIALERPHRAFVLLLPEFPNEPEPDYAILRHPGGGRKDVLIWGNPAQTTSTLRIEIYRPGNEALEASAPETEELGTVTAKEPRPTIASKFGELALTEFSAQSKDQTRRCVGFARTFDAPRLRIAGWYCKGTDEIIDPAFIACALDRLTLIAAGSDPRVAELFAKAELARQFCHAKGTSRGANIRRHDWLSTSRDPRLRGRFVTR
jgi:hypothetical protein